MMIAMFDIIINEGLGGGAGGGGAVNKPYV